MGWECSSLVNPTVAAFLLHGLSPTSSSSRCPSSGRSCTFRAARLDGTAGTTTAATRGSRSPRRSLAASAGLDDSPDGSQQQLNFSVLRFTLGIPGLDESYLPRYIGFAFGSLIILNHFLGSSDSTTPAQLRSEALGICLAGFSIALPYFGNFLKLMSVGDALCIRGYWNLPEDASKVQVLDLFRRQIQQAGLIDLKDTLYFPQGVDPQFLGALPKGTFSVLVQPVYGAYDPNGDGVGEDKGFILLASCSSYAYRDSDRTWIRVVANKFQDDQNPFVRLMVSPQKKNAYQCAIMPFPFV